VGAVERTAGSRQYHARHDNRFDDASGGTGLADGTCTCCAFHDQMKMKKPPRTLVFLAASVVGTYSALAPVRRRAV